MLDRKEYKFIVDKLINTNETLLEIAQQVGCNLTTVKNVNDGKTRRARDFYDKEFPIRITKKRRNEHMSEIFARRFSVDDILEEYPLSRTTVVKILHKLGWRSVKRGEWVRKNK